MHEINGSFIFQTGALVQLTNVRAEMVVSLDSSVYKWPYLCFKLDGNNCSVKIFNGFEAEGIKLKR